MEKHLTTSFGRIDLNGKSILMMLVLSIGILVGCSHQSQKYTVFSVRSSPAGGSWRLLDDSEHLRTKGDGENPSLFTKKVGGQVPTNGLQIGGMIGFASGAFVVLTLVAPPVGLGLGLGGPVLGAFLWPAGVSKGRKEMNERVVELPLKIAFEHPDYPTQIVPVSLKGYPTQEKATQHAQTIEHTFTDNNTFKLLKLMLRSGIRKLAIIRMVDPFAGFTQGLIDFQQGAFQVLERDKDTLKQLLSEQGFSNSGAVDTSNSYATLGKLLGVDALIYVYIPAPETAAGLLSQNELNRVRHLTTEQQEQLLKLAQVRLLKVVNIQTGQIIFESVISGVEFAAATQTAFFRRSSGMAPVAGAGSGEEPQPGVLPLKGRALVLINEQNVSGPIIPWHKKVMVKSADLGVVENELIAQLLPRGLRFVDPEVLSKTLAVHQGLKVTDLTVDQVRKLGQLTGADYVLFGKAVAVKSTGTPVENLYPVQATLSLRLVSVKDGEILSAANVVGSGLHAEFISAGTKALTEAARQAAQKLEKTLVAVLAAREKAPVKAPEKTPAAVESGETVVVRLTKVGSFDAVGGIMKVLKTAAGEKLVKFVSLDAQVLVIEVMGLASFEIGSALEKVKTTPMKITKITTEAVEGELK